MIAASKQYADDLRACRTAYLIPIPHVFLSGRDCYALRCAVTHQGSDQTDRQAARDALTRFQFVVSKPSILVHNNLHGDMLQLDLREFCNDICVAVEAWVTQTAGDPGIEDEKSRLLKIYQFDF